LRERGIRQRAAEGQSFAHWIVTWLMASVLFAAVPGAGAQEGEAITLNLKNADIQALVSTVSDVTGRNFIVDPRVKGKVTVISGRPMAGEELYQVFLSILNVHGFAVVPAENASKIVPLVNAKQDAIPTASAREPGKGDQYVTRVVQVDNVAVAQLVPILRPLLPQQGHLAAYPPSNVLIASGEAANVQRLVTIIERIDVSGDEEIEVIPLQHAAAGEMVRILQSLQQGAAKQPAPSGQPTIVADERTNSVLISGAKTQRLRLRGIVAHLDTPLEEAGGNTEVIYLRYANAKELVEVLTGVGTGISEQQAAGKGNGKGANRSAAAAGKANFDIQADESTNALVITAAPDVMRSLKSVVQKLDVRRAQVLVEGIIAELSSNTATDLGVNWAADGSPNNDPVGIINFGAVDLFKSFEAGDPQVGAGLNLAVGDTQANGTRFGAFLNALSSDAGTNILSTPSLLTMDNEEAEIVVGQNVPFVTGSYTSTGSGSTPQSPFQTIQRQDVGLTLKVKPQINEGDAIKLEVTQEVSSISPSATGASDLITNKRSLNTTVMVDDGEVVALGGLIDDDLKETVNKVPGLGDIPLLGYLFSSRSTQKVKRNLMVFLHPVILRDKLQASAVASEKYNYLRALQLQEKAEGVGLMSDDVAPVLPEMDELLVLPPPFEETAAAAVNRGESDSNERTD